jgi:cobalamin biosynthesis protein CbiG
MKAAGSDLSAVTSTGLIGWCRWAGYQAVGFVLAVPIAIELLFKLITK